MPVVVDEAKLTEFVHEVADPGSGGADHLRQCFLTDIGIDRHRYAGRPGTGGILRLRDCGSGVMEGGIAEQEAAPGVAILHGHRGSHGGGAGAGFCGIECGEDAVLVGCREWRARATAGRLGGAAYER